MKIVWQMTGLGPLSPGCSSVPMVSGKRPYPPRRATRTRLGLTWGGVGERPHLRHGGLLAYLGYEGTPTVGDPKRREVGGDTGRPNWRVRHREVSWSSL